MTDTDAKKRPSLVSLLQMLTDADNAMATIDPAEVIGDLRDKVDAVKAVLDRLEASRAWAEAQAAPFLDAAKAAKANHDRLEAYVLRSMQAEGFERLAGRAWRVAVKVNPASMKTLRQPDEDDDPRYAELHQEWRWKNAAIKADLLRGALTFEDCDPWAMIYHRTKVEFEPNLPELEDV